MKFDAKQLKAAVETIRLPADMGERLRKNCLAVKAGEAEAGATKARATEMGATETRATETGKAGRRSRARRNAVLAGIAACAVLAVGFGLWRAGGGRLWNDFWYAGSGAVSSSDDGPPTVGGEDTPAESSGGDLLRPAESSGGNQPSVEPPGEPSGEVGEPPASIELGSLAELEEMRKMAVCTDEDALQAYLGSLAGMGASSREDLAAFLRLVDSLPYPSFVDGEITWISYAAESRVAILSAEGTNGDRVRLEYHLNVGDVPAEMEAWEANGYFKGSLLQEPLSCFGGRGKVYCEKREKHPSLDGILLIDWEMEADGVFLRVFYYTDAPDRVVTEEVFGGLTLRRIGELP